jgi:hypothetical protein
LQAGDDTPGTRTTDHGEEPVMLTFTEPTVLCFYPRDDTPGCATETEGFDEGLTAYRDAGVAIVASVCGRNGAGVGKGIARVVQDRVVRPETHGDVATEHVDDGRKPGREPHVHPEIVYDGRIRLREQSPGVWVPDGKF